jgi:hypothetical protein
MPRSRAAIQKLEQGEIVSRGRRARVEFGLCCYQVEGPDRQKRRFGYARKAQIVGRICPVRWLVPGGRDGSRTLRRLRQSYAADRVFAASGRGHSPRALLLQKMRPAGMGQRARFSALVT